MKPTISRILILGSAFIAHAERSHGGAVTIIGRAGHDRQPRSTVSAIEKGIAVSAVRRIEELSQARVAGGHIGRDKNRTTRIRLAPFDSKFSRATRRLQLPRQPVDVYQRWKC